MMRGGTGAVADNNNAMLFSHRLYEFTMSVVFCLRLGLGLDIVLVRLGLGFG